MSRQIDDMYIKISASYQERMRGTRGGKATREGPLVARDARGQGNKIESQDLL